MIARRARTVATLAFVILLAAMGIGQARAGAISVMPVRVDVAADRRFCSLTLGNDGERPVTVQVRGFAWTRDETGADILTPDPGFMVNPGITTIAPHGNRLVRCSLPAAEPVNPTERQWRLIVDELPDPDVATPGVVQTLLRISVPVFRGDAKAAPRLAASLDHGVLRLANTGTVHVKVLSVVLKGAGAPVALNGTFYLLAGGSRALAPLSVPLGVANVHVRAEEGEFDVVLDGAK
jgi:fimbrial chaperone protein